MCNSLFEDEICFSGYVVIIDINEHNFINYRDILFINKDNTIYT